MSDEAAPYYVDMVDQQTIGHQFLLSLFGPAAIPKTGWQVRPHVQCMQREACDHCCQVPRCWLWEIVQNYV